MVYLAPPEKKNGFSIFRNDKKTDKLIVFAATTKEKSEWIDLINGCVANCSNFIKEKTENSSIPNAFI